MSTTDFEYPDIKKTDFIDESLPKILARDDASKHGFRRVESFPNVTADDVGMKIWWVGVGNGNSLQTTDEIRHIWIP